MSGKVEKPILVSVELNDEQIKSTGLRWPQTLDSIQDHILNVLRSKSNLRDEEIERVEIKLSRYFPWCDGWEDVDSETQVEPGYKYVAQITSTVPPAVVENMVLEADTPDVAYNVQLGNPTPPDSVTPQPSDEHAPASGQNSLAEQGCSMETVPTNKYKFLFPDEKAWDIAEILNRCDGPDRNQISTRFTEEGMSKPGFDEARQTLVAVCGKELMRMVYESGRDKPTPIEKARMAFSMWKHFPFYKPSVSIPGTFPYSKLYDPLVNKGYLENYICNRVRGVKSKEAKRQPQDSDPPHKKPKQPRGPQNEVVQTPPLDVEVAQLKLQQLRTAAPDGKPISRHKVIDLMRELFDHRRHWITTNDNADAHAILQTYPCLSTMPELMFAEFEEIAKAMGITLPNMDSRWQVISNFVIEEVLAARKKQPSMQQNLMDAFDIRSLDEARSLSPEQRANLALQFLPILLPPQPHGSGSGSKDTVPVPHAITHLIQHRKIPDNTALRSVIDSAKADTSLTQPFLLALTPYGGEGELAAQVFVVVDYSAIEVPNASYIKSLKYLFASFYVFNTDYPQKSLGLVYQFLEHMFGFAQNKSKSKRAKSTKALDLFDRAMHYVKTHESADD